MSDPQQTTIAYRPHLDGVRAYGVLVVVAFHAGWTGGRGVAGMDAFFALSGFLITTLTFAELDRGSFGVVRFWARRARRLVPALAVMLLTVTALVRWLDPPAVWGARRGDLVASALYWANWHFQRLAHAYSTSDFASGSPLAHTWSLAVEEQFYLAFPLVVAFAAMFRRRAAAVLAAVAGVVFAGSVWFGLTRDPVVVHYDTRARLFAISAGVLTALLLRALPRLSPRLARVGLWVVTPSALALIFGLDASAVDRARWLFLAVVVSVCAFVYLAESAPAHPWVRLFGCAPLVWVGQRTYGLYLWHLPALVFVPRLVGWTPGWSSLAAVAVALVCADVSLRLVERPVRRAGWLARRSGVAAAGSVAVVAAVAAVSVAALPDPPRWELYEEICADGSPACRIFDAAGFGDRSWESGASSWSCPGDAADDAAFAAGSDDVQYSGDPLCVLYRPDDPVLVVALVGDSTAKALAPGLLVQAAARRWMLVGAAKNSCPWAIPDAAVTDPGWGPLWRCQPAVIAAQKRLVSEFDPDVVVVSSALAGSSLMPPPSQGQLDAVARLRAGGAQVVFAGPARRPLPPECVSSDLGSCASYRDAMAWQEQFVRSDLGQLDALAAADPHVRVAARDVHAVLCDSTPCPWTADGRALYADPLHLSIWGSVTVAPVVADAVAAAAAGR